MHPIEKKKRVLAYTVIALAIVMNAFCITISRLYFLILIAIIIAVYMKKGSLSQKIVLVGLYSLISNTIIYLLIKFVLKYAELDALWFIIVGSFIVLGSKPGKWIKNELKRINSNLDLEMKHHSIFKQFPNVICTKHLVRTKLKRSLFSRKVNCRKSNECVSLNKLIEAQQLVGIIGGFHDSGKRDNDFCVEIMDNWKDSVTNGDYDVIEIYENPIFKNYDAAIYKVVDCLYNDFRRCKPINKIIVRIIGQPQIAKSTEHLLKEKFLRVEYKTY